MAQEKQLREQLLGDVENGVKASKLLGVPVLSYDVIHASTLWCIDVRMKDGSMLRVDCRLIE